MFQIRLEVAGDNDHDLNVAAVKHLPQGFGCFLQFRFQSHHFDRTLGLAGLVQFGFHQNSACQQLFHLLGPLQQLGLFSSGIRVQRRLTGHLGI